MCLLLWGLHEVRYGISRAFGAQLHRFISVGTRTRPGAFFAGLFSTTILQSSMATALILTGFCTQGLVSVSAGLAVMLGADLGTTLVVQILSFDLSWVAPLLITTGFILFRGYERAGKWGHIGKFLFGLGLMLMALAMIRESAAPLRESQVLSVLLTSLGGDLFLPVLIAALMTWLMHSSLAFILLLVPFATSGILPVSESLMMVLGANLGTVFPPFIATLKDKPPARRVIGGNMLIRGVSVLLCLPFLGYVEDLVRLFGDDPGRIIVNFHTGFNLLIAIVFLPLTPIVARIGTRLIPDEKRGVDPGVPKYLDEKAAENPSVGLAAAARETLRMADLVETMLEETMMALRHNDEKLVAQIREQDNIVDRLYRAIKMYMARISQEQLDPDEATRYVQILTFSTNIENLGDLIDKSMIPMTLKKIKEHKRFSQEGWMEIQEVHQFVVGSVRLAQNVFLSDDIRLARQLVERKDELRMKETRLTVSHMERIREGVPEAIATSSLHLDIIRDYRRINSYMCTVAYPLLEGKGQLHQSRLIPVE
ncbi:MAG: Na/Pi cotransporter family protein [Alphaproteobacteria bacterium]|nr:Na/Pi cotransporter family protein [Alphaproteobacteria bacterium]